MNTTSIVVRVLPSLLLLPCLLTGCGSTDEPRIAGATGGKGGSSGLGGASVASVSGAGGMSSGGGLGAASSQAASSGGTTGGAGGGAVQPFDWVGIIGTGQSLSLGFQSTSISLTQPFHNLKLVDQGPDPKYPIDGSATAVWSAVPLVEPIREDVPGYPDAINTDYPNNLFVGAGMGDMGYGETPHSGMANTLSSLWVSRGNKSDYITAHSVVGTGGACLASIDAPDSTSFKAAISETKVWKKLADAAGKTYGVGGVILTHGECDAIIDNADYGAQILDLQQAYDSQIKAVTGQTRNVVFFASQESSFPDGYQSVAVQIWQESIQNPSRIVCTGPKYAFGPYGVHMPAPEYERIGEKYAEVFDLVVNQGIAWKPLGPSSITRVGAVITATFDVPVPPLVWDQHLSPVHQQVNTAWAQGRGFEVEDGMSNQLAIASVAIQDSSVVITLAAAPAPGVRLVLGYAVTPDEAGGYDGGEPAGLHGLLRDSDDFTGYSAETIAVKATLGSPMITAATMGGFNLRGVFDVVTGSGLAGDTIVSTVAGDQITLSAPWTGATGATNLGFKHDAHNYCVHFSMPVP